MSSFSKYMATVDSYLEEWLGVTTDCLPDNVDYHNMFDHGYSAKQTAAMTASLNERDLPPVYFD